MVHHREGRNWIKNLGIEAEQGTFEMHLERQDPDRPPLAL
jgi:hypothetical protein